MEPSSAAEIVSSLERRVLIVLWSATIGLWALTLICLAAGAKDLSGVFMIGALCAMFAAFFASFVVMMRAGIKTRR
jgi:hypothetical protein